METRGGRECLISSCAAFTEASVMSMKLAVWYSSDYRKYLPGQFIKNRLNIDKSSIFLDIFSSAIINDLTITFTSRLKVEAICANQQSI